jgi:hypothetical protein
MLTNGEVESHRLWQPRRLPTDIHGIQQREIFRSRLFEHVDPDRHGWTIKEREKQFAGLGRVLVSESALEPARQVDEAIQQRNTFLMSALERTQYTVNQTAGPRFA